MSWIEMLHGHVAEEATDHAEYMKIAEEAEAAGCCHEAGVLRDIAHEEKIHHKLLAEIAGEFPVSAKTNVHNEESHV